VRRSFTAGRAPFVASASRSCDGCGSQRRSRRRARISSGIGRTSSSTTRPSRPTSGKTRSRPMGSRGRPRWLSRLLAELVVEPQAWHHFDRALEEVHREVGKVIFSLLANFAAERASEQGSAERALALAKAALVAATAVSQHSQALVARASLARLAMARGDARAVREAVALIDAELLSGPGTLSARARAAAERVCAQAGGDRSPLHGRSMSV